MTWLATPIEHVRDARSLLLLKWRLESATAAVRFIDTVSTAAIAQAADPE